MVALSPSDLTKTGEGGLLMLPLKNRRVSVCLQLRHSTAHRNLLSGQELTGRWPSNNSTFYISWLSWNWIFPGIVCFQERIVMFSLFVTNNWPCWHFAGLACELANVPKVDCFQLEKVGKKLISCCLAQYLLRIGRKSIFFVKLNFFSWFWKFVMSSKDEGAFISLYFHLCEAVCSSYKGVEDATHILFWETTMGCLIVDCHNIPLLIVVTSHAATFISHAPQQQWSKSSTWQRWQKLLHNLV